MTAATFRIQVLVLGPIYHVDCLARRAQLSPQVFCFGIETTNRGTTTKSEREGFGSPRPEARAPMSTAVATPAHTRSSRFRNFVVTAAAKTVESIKQLSPQRMRGVMKRADRAKATIKLSVPFQQELAGTGSGDGETSPSVASSTDATVKASPRHSQVRVTTGSQIYLVKADCVVTVVGMDVIGQRYLLRNEDTKYEWYEILTGSGRVKWNPVASKPTPLPLQGESSCSACEEPPPPKEAPAPRMTRKMQSKVVLAAELAAEEFQCPICKWDLNDTSAPHRGEWGAHMHPPQRCSPPRPPPLSC